MAASAGILSALHATKYVRGYTHPFYRYPAATSPGLARELVLAFTDPDDVVCDPFVGGGTVGVETLAAGRRFLGSDLNELAVFVTKAKTTPVSRKSWDAAAAWASARSLFGEASQSDFAANAWLPEPLGAALASGRSTAEVLNDPGAQRVVLCALLRLGQWALEARDDVPPVEELQERLKALLARMQVGMDDLIAAAADAGITNRSLAGNRAVKCCSASDLSASRAGNRHASQVKLLLTSPPYPGVHVLYHRWQVRGRRETAAPYRVIGAQDGHFMPYYTMGGRSESGKRQYFQTLTETFAALRPLLAPDALVAVVVGFAQPEVQEVEFHSALHAAGYEAHDPLEVPRASLVRDVPNRRWYVRGKKHSAAHEALLFYRVP